jgi:acyl carrier protein
MNDKIRAILTAQAKLAVDVGALSDEDDLHRAGLTSHATVNVMLALEDAFDVEFPDHLLRKSTFSSIAAIHAALSELCVVSG